jgi:excisionase family DNA binding protein
MFFGSDSLIAGGDPLPTIGVTADLDELLTVADAARLLKVTASCVYEHTRNDAEDRLPVVKVGKYLRFDRRDLREYINSKREVGRTTRGRR